MDIDICSAKGCHARARVGAAVEQPEDPHARASQGVAGVRRAPGSRSRDFLGARGFLKDVVEHES